MVEDDPQDPTLITLTIAKHLAREVRAALKAGRDAKIYVRTYREQLILGGTSASDAHVFATHASAQGNSASVGEMSWTWRECVDAFLKRKLQKLKEGRNQQQYARYLRHAAFTPIAGRRVAELRFLDLFRIQQALTPGGGPDEDGRPNSTTFRCMSEAVAMLDWAKTTKPVESGLAYVAEPWWRQIKVDYSAKKRLRAPGPDELARTLAIVEHERRRNDDPLVVMPGVLAALRVGIATGQRVGALIQLERANIKTHPDEEGWWIAHWTADQMKTPLDHAIPIPPTAYAVMREAWDEIDRRRALRGLARSKWAFPSHRGDGHVAPNAISQLFDRLRGKPARTSYKAAREREGKPGPKPSPSRGRARPNLFRLSGIDDWTMHDGRRSITNELVNAGLGRAASAILAHTTEIRLPLSEETLHETMARTTSKHYFTAQQIHLKTEGMKLWSETLTAALQRERVSPKRDH
ncbi:hypothetical protein [Chenggangzhangella methanolivorans]|uniref:Phage integrase family protein n=1 Tax=Chenggangzhangella methanolivorans TaxID=1437009 RepID=A0A9E6RC53_9HYPH|nr:hypothetical protein [Chenggangzhangella methanolivorans]QZO00508.1 hypothetical protein K6K41_01860 [Chenggangzhangella methanolivorans]